MSVDDPTATRQYLEGMAWEAQVTAGLTRRGYSVEPFGQVLVSPRLRAWLRAGTVAPVLRWLPDLLVQADGVVRAVDAKGGWRYRETRRHDVETASVWAACEWETFTGIDEWFVFRDGGCIRPADVLSLGVEGRHNGSGSGTRFLLIPVEACLHVDDVFPEVTR